MIIDAFVTDVARATARNINAFTITQTFLERRACYSFPCEDDTGFSMRTQLRPNTVYFQEYGGLVVLYLSTLFLNCAFNIFIQ